MKKTVLGPIDEAFATHSFAAVIQTGDGKVIVVLTCEGASEDRLAFADRINARAPHVTDHFAEQHYASYHLIEKESMFL